MEMSPLVVLSIFGTGLILFRSAVVKVAAVVFLLIGVLVTGSEFGSWVGNCAQEAYRLLT